MGLLFLPLHPPPPLGGEGDINMLYLRRLLCKARKINSAENNRAARYEACARYLGA